MLKRHFVWIALTVLLIAGGALRALNLFQSGFAPDEEITWFAVRGIGQHSIPILPSGIIYDRGIPYSYSAWLSGLIFGQTIVAYRIVSFLSGLASILFTFLLGRKTGDLRIGLMAAAFVAFTPWAILISDWARFYSLFLTFALLTCLAYYSSKRILYLVLLSIACLLHESGIVLILLPLLHFLISGNDETIPQKRKDLLNLALIAVVLVALIFVGKGLLIPSLARKEYLNLYEERTLMDPPLDHLALKNLPAVLFVLMLGSAFLWLLHKRSLRIALPCAIIGLILASILELGVLLILMLFGMLLDPANKRNYAIGAIGLSLLSVLIWVFQSAVHLGISSFPERFISILTYGFAFPLNSLKYFVTHWPIFSAISLLAVANLKDVSQPNRIKIVVTGLGLASVILIGLLQVPLQPRYFLLASILLFLVVSFWIARSKHRHNWILCCLVVLLMLSEQYISLKESVLLHLTPGWFRPASLQLRTFQIESQQNILNLIKADDVIVSNDELAAIYLFGRCNYWFLPQSHYSNRFRFERAGHLHGWYGGSPILANAQELKSVVQKESKRRFLLILLGTGKFGGSRNQILQEIRDPFNETAFFSGSEKGSVLILRLNP